MNERVFASEIEPGLVAGRVAFVQREGERVFRVSDALVAESLLDWSEPVQLRLERRDDRTYDLIARTVASQIDAAVRDADTLAEALRWYAERRNYAEPAPLPPDIGYIGEADGFDGEGPGARARAALASSPGRERGAVSAAAATDLLRESHGARIVDVEDRGYGRFRLWLEHRGTDDGAFIVEVDAKDVRPMYDEDTAG